MVPRRLAAVHFPALPLEVVFEDLSPARAVQGELRGRPILVAVTEEARRRGVRPGMSPSEAKARLPELELKPRDLSLEAKRLSRAAELLLGFGPHVELALPDLAYVEIGRSRRVLKKWAGEGEEAIALAITKVLLEAGHRVSVVITRDPDTGRTLAEHLSRPVAPPKKRSKKHPNSPPPVQVVPVGGEAAALSRLPLSALRWTDLRDDPEGRLKERLTEALASLKLLGIEEIGRLSSLPEAQLGSRFGEAGVLLAARAQARLDRPLRTFTPPSRIVEELDLESVVEDLEPMLFVLRRIYGHLEARLDARNLAATSLLLRFVVEPDLSRKISADAVREASSKLVVPLTLSLARPTRKAATFFNITKEKLGGALPGAVRAVTVEALGTAPDRGAQLDLFNNHQKQLEEVGELVGRLQAALGEHAVFSPEILDRHRPEGAWKIRPFDLEQALLPPATKKPVRLSAALPPAPAPTPRSPSPLPVVDGSLQVALPLAPEAVETRVELPTTHWPKPAAPRVDPLPPLPPRPLELLERPEAATLLAPSGLDEGVLLWRGQRLPLVNFLARERLEAEWWTEAPVEREYTIAETADGRRLWLYFGSEGAFVHGVFD